MTQARTLPRIKRRLALAVTGVLAVGALAACADNSSEKSDGSSLPSRTVEAGKPVSDEKIAEISMGVLGKIPQLDPVERTEAGVTVISNILEPLMRVDEGGELQPWLATKYEAISDTVHEYTLREGVKFWDGTELTSEDVKYTWERSKELDDRPGFASVETIEAPDEYTIRVTLSQPDAAFQYAPAQFYAGIYQKAFAEETGEKFGQPDTLVMGTGPWQVDSLNPTTGMELSAFEDYWGGKAPIEQIDISFFADDSAMALALRSGEIDFAQGVAAPDAFDAAAGGGTITTVSTCATAVVSLPVQTPPWDDVHVRRAVAHAIDRDDIVGATQGRAGGPLDTLIAPVMLQPLGSEGEVEEALDSVPTLELDVAKAKEELAKSSVPDGFSTEIKVVPANSAVAEVIAAQLTEIGIDTEVVEMQDTAWYAEIAKPEPPFTFTETGGCTPDPGFNDIFLATDAAGAPTGVNLSGYAAPEMIELRDRGVTTTDPAERLQIYTDQLTHLAEEVPYVPVYLEGATYASTKYQVADYGSYAMNFPWLLNLMPT